MEHKIRRLLNILMGKHSIIILITILLILDILLIARLIAPVILQFIIDQHIFEVVVLITLVEVLILLSFHLWSPAILVIESEEEAQEKIRALLKEDNSIKSIKVLSAGLSSRARFLRALLEDNSKLKLEIVACFGEGSPNPDKLDREQFGPTHCKVITHRLIQDESSRLKIYKSLNTPSFRCILLLDSHGPRYGIVGWYTYHKKIPKLLDVATYKFF